MAAPRGGDLDQLHKASGCHSGQKLELAPRSEGRSPALMRGEAEPRRPPQSADRDGLLWQVRPGWSVPKERDPASLWKGSDGAAQANAHFG
jgi:hypothetical protein